MLSEIGVPSIESLFSPIPAELRTKQLDLPEGLSEYESLHRITDLAGSTLTDRVCFLGGGAYDHIIPAAVGALANRAEFVTAYTPYQPESSQGTLQALFEYQTAMCALTGMEVTNASMYDGASALAESVLMAMRITDRKRVLVDEGVNPVYRRVIATYLVNHDCEIVEIPLRKDLADEAAILAGIDDRTACVVIQNPNFLGSILDIRKIAEKAHSVEALVVESIYPVSLGILESPAARGADISTGDGQSLGNPLSFGGPSFGFLAVKKTHIRQLPGRIVGETIDRDGKRAFVLTLQAREQHIKRHKATSNICSNQSLCALRALFHMSVIGREGFAELAQLNLDLAAYARKTLSAIKGVKTVNEAPVFNEFVLELPVETNMVVEKLAKKGYYAGIPLGKFYPGREKQLLVAVTEKRTKSEIDGFARLLEESLWR
jgi:glycine dehydrogenase subunit 1